MKQLLIVRHAKSSWDAPELSDHDRPLSRRGKRDAPRMAQWLFEYGMIPGRIISSTAKRARKTAKEIAKRCDITERLELNRDLYFGEPENWIELLQETEPGAACVMLVGHNPGSEDFLEQLIGQYERLPTAAIAHVESPVERWTDFRIAAGGQLVTLQRPRELP
ncbi:phosphohistidine phosphatase [Symmachiella macrocystis]|uniref:Phosphohistidine phosphatase n=1 Tax=Symmachiella macrocystis TaxID=2527985 RepID=A0A5C6B442_9PLAN|nr:histidine phosphatase family protein [Symmachiella macrocystis]TWU06933.1 phosphohistidine phosphatase [Symmachiella macrocystis]